MGNPVQRGPTEPIGDRESPREGSVADPTTASQFDDLFALLSDRRCRHVLYLLAGMEDPVAERSQLVAWLAIAENGADVDDSLETAIETDLHHHQLPRLEDAGLVDYDPRQGTIRYAGLPFETEWLEHACYRETGKLL